MALFQHLGLHRDHAIENPFDVDVDTALPGSKRFFMVGVKRQRHDPRVINHDVYSTELLNSKASERVHLLRGSDVHCTGHGSSASCTNPCNDCFEPRFVNICTDDLTAKGRDLFTNQTAKGGSGRFICLAW